MSKGTILCVDDDRTVLQALKAQLRRRFSKLYRIELSESAEEALEILEDLEADGEADDLVVISDWLMPGTRGDTLLIQVHERFPNALTILLTGQADEDAMTRAREGANAPTLDKPWMEEVLGELIAQKPTMH